MTQPPHRRADAAPTAANRLREHLPEQGRSRRLLGSLAQRTRAGSSGLVLSLMATALVSTAFGVGALGQSDEVSDGAAWLWNAATNEALRINGNNAEIDLVASLPEAEGARVQVEQNDDHLLLIDPETGKVTSVDLNELGFSGRLELGSGDHGVVLGKETAVVIDRAGGEIRAVDPATLQATGNSLTLEGPLVGGAFDDSDTLWVGAPSQGHTVGIQVTEGEAAITQTVAVASPGADIGVTVFDDGALAVDRGGSRVVAMREGDDPVMVTMPAPMADSAMPARTRGEMAAVTKTEDDEIVTLLHPYGAAETTLFPVEQPGSGVAVPFAGRVYVPFDDEGIVRSYAPDGRELDSLTLPDAEGPLELEAREGSLFVNAPDTGSAAVVDETGRATLVDTAEAPPGPGEIRGETPAVQPENGAPVPDSPPVGNPDPGGDPGNQNEGSPGGSEGGPGNETTNDPGTQDPEPGQSTGPPGAPTPVTAQAGDGSVELTWPEAYSPDAPVQSYEITWEGGGTTVGGSELHTEITGLANGTAYRFRVRAINEYGTGPAAQSPQVIPDREAPGAPGSVLAEASGNESATVSWEGADNAVDYLVSSNAQGGASAPSNRTTSSTSLVVTGLEPGATYTFTVTSRGAGGVTGESATSSSVTMPEIEVGAPDSVTHSVSSGSVSVSWTAVENAEQYRITPHGDGAANGMAETTVAAENTSHSFTRSQGRCFSFTVRALGPGGIEGEGAARSTPACEREFL
ncbi:fibronectin type III domain-containing protein [Nocardiopsis metallicus]|uniref:Putative cupredoxin-like copper-binding protein n=1 Tax=Nocardiopsis metallicus TaxID=179819 RepID=A0A840WFX3_9ACTN|nr:fibronectin type III domain-containing protein [Nocardiopsis metallicus]MBB5490627.1 putative cupredoxin-like copper-binding protein [Nocardiopsis metallicus]